MKKLIKNMSVKTKIFLVLLLTIGICTSVVAYVRASQVREQQQALIIERLKGNANLAVGIFKTVRNYTTGILDVVATMPYVQETLTVGADEAYEWLEANLASLLNGMNQTDDGVLVYANIFLFDRDLNLVVKARPEGTDMDLTNSAFAGNLLAAHQGLPYTSPVVRNAETKRMQFFFTQPVMLDGEFIGLAAILSNSEVLSFFLREPSHDFDSFINIADSEGTIFFSNRSVYAGKTIEDLGVEAAFGYIPFNEMFYHTSAVTGVEKIAYITTEPSLDWTIISFFDADAVGDTGRIIFTSLFPTLLSIILASVFMLMIVSRSLKPLKPLAAAAEQVAGGSLNINFFVDKNDEISRVSRSFLKIVDTLGILRDNFSKAEQSMLHGDTDYHLEDARLSGVFDEMFESTNNIFMHMQRSRLEAEHASKAKSDFLATMSHEIRTPMNAILGITQIELQNENLPKKYAKALSRIYDSGNNLLGIINDILDMSKIETGKMELHPVEYDVPSIIYDTVQLNMIRIGSKPVEFELNIDEKLPSRMFGDELRLKQILNNLLSNAIKYTEKGFVKLLVRYRRENEKIILRFDVEDTGQGLKPEDRERLFSEYSRFNTEANRTTEGTGIGLNITRSLVELMDGTITVESEYGKGSIFTVEVKQKAIDCPAIGADVAERLRNFTFIAERQSGKLQVTRVPMPYGSVLVVDDVDTNLFVAQGLLAPYKLKIETVSSGFAAIEKVRAGASYDVIFMDHMMPQMDGIETTQKLRGFGYKGTIVALTANALVGNDEMFKKKGFDGFIAKPIDIRQLNAALNQFVRDRHPEEAKKYKKEAASQAQVYTAKVDSELMKIFCRDAEKAVVTLRETTDSQDLKLFKTTAHAMKAALANVGEHEASRQAEELENIGFAADTDRMIETLEALIAKYKSAGSKVLGSPSHDEDTAFLKAQLQIVKTACENYDDKAAYAAFDRLKEKQWKPENAAMLEELRGELFLHSDFDGVAERLASLI